MSKRLASEQIAAAVEWWTNAILAPSFDMLGPTRSIVSGQERLHEIFATGMASQNAEAHPPSSEAIQRFREELTRRLSEVDAGDWFCLDVDYDPCEMLRQAGDAAGIHFSRWPWKTRMTFECGSVHVKEGYGAPLVKILPGDNHAHR